MAKVVPHEELLPTAELRARMILADGRRVKRSVSSSVVV
jgi:hypothetical protein